jgi:phosphopantetheinyl transferase
MNLIMVLHGSIPRVADPVALAALRASLPYGKRLELESAIAEDAAATLYGIALALEGLRRAADRYVRPDELRFPQGGKPSVDGPASFSISHSSRRVGCAIGRAQQVGFDLEPREARASTIDTHRWTAVEAVLKAAGAGLIRAHDVELDGRLESGRLDGRDYRLYRLALHDDSIAHLAADAAVTVEVHEVELGTVLTNCLQSASPARVRLDPARTGT